MVLNRLFSSWRPFSASAAFDAPLAPEIPFAAVGDLHGRADLLDRLLKRLEANAPNLPLIFVGDYIDRGEESARVLKTLQTLEQIQERVICLVGNHEQMCLRFLEAPDLEGERWLRFGGLQTLASYGVTDVVRRAGAGEMAAIRDALADKMGADLVDWLHARPRFWRSGNIAVVHAGADPARPIDVQENSLIWGHAAFESTPRSDGLWIVHGHTIVDAPKTEAGRIAIDTGAYATGRLTAAVISPEDGVEFMTA